MDDNSQTLGQRPSSQAEEHTLVQFPNQQTANPVTPQPAVSQPAQNTASPVIPTPIPSTPTPQSSSTSTQQPSTSTQPVQPVIPPQVPMQPQEISTSKFKESAPLPSLTKPTEWMAPTEKPIDLESSVEKVGVKEVSHTPQLTNDHRQAGIKEAKESIPAPMITSASGSNTKMPMPKQKAEEVVKGPLFFKKSSSSMLWLAFLILKNYNYLEQKEKEDKQKQ